FFYVKAGATQVDKAIGNDLARAMVGDLPATVGAHNRNGATVKYVFRLAGLAQRIDGLVLDQPDFVGRFRPAFFGEVLHGLPHVGVRYRPGQPFDGNHYRTIDTRWWPCSARYRLSSCSREVARTVKVRPM